MADWKELVDAAIEAKGQAYAKYSRFPVGAALLCKDGTVVKGCNVENAVYPLSLCAERTAVVKAVSDGRREFTAIAVVTQVLSEFSSDGSLQVVMAKPDGKCEVKTISYLLPSAFSQKELQEVNADAGT